MNTPHRTLARRGRRSTTSTRSAARIAAALATLLATTLLAPSPAGAQSGNVADVTPVVTATGPTVVHDAAYDGVRTEVRSIDVPFSGLSLLVLNVRNMPQIGRNRVFGAHAHAKPCAADAAASGPHHANPVGDVTKTLAGREVWLDIRIDELGRGTSIGLFDWRIRKDSRVIVRERSLAPPVAMLAERHAGAKTLNAAARSLHLSPLGRGRRTKCAG